MLERHVNAPLTSSAGRLFDAVASLLNVRQECTFEGQAAMELEYLADRATDQDTYPFSVSASGVNGALIIDWGLMVRAILRQTMEGTRRESIALRFHNTLAMIIVRVAEEIGLERVVLTGGCFQNRVLTERTVRGLEKAGFRPYWHQRVPPNDGGISLGQIKAASLLQEFMGRR
jgi:hydrogenase maturation protein HypF